MPNVQPSTAHKARAAIMIPTIPAAEAPIWTLPTAAPEDEDEAAVPEAVEEPDADAEEPEPDAADPEPEAAAPVVTAAPLPEAEEPPVAAAPEAPVALKKRELIHDCWHLP